MGTISASFQDAGKQPARYEQFSMLVIGVGSRPAFRAGQKPAIGKKGGHMFFGVYSIRDLTCCFKVNLTL
jgi:hypothetical protein